LALCQRYYCKSFEPGTAPAYGTTWLGGWTSYTTGNAYTSGTYVFPVQMRSTPTVTFYNGNTGSNVGTLDYYNGSWIAMTTAAVGAASSTNLNVSATKPGSFTTNTTYLMGGSFTASAEL